MWSPQQHSAYAAYVDGERQRKRRAAAGYVLRDTFDDGVFTEWTPADNGGDSAVRVTLTAAPGAMRVTLVSAANGGARANRLITTVAGVTYEVVVVRSGGTAVSGSVVRIDDVTLGDAFFNGTFRFTFVGAGGTQTLSLRSQSGVAGEYSDFERVTIKPSVV